MANSHLSPPRTHRDRLWLDLSELPLCFTCRRRHWPHPSGCCDICRHLPKTQQDAIDRARLGPVPYQLMYVEV